MNHEDPEARLDNLIERLEAQAERINERYNLAVERMADATNHEALGAAIENLQDIARHSHHVGQILAYHKHQKQLRSEARQHEARLS